MACSEAMNILQNVHDLPASLQAERMLDACPKTVNALHALEAAIGDEFEVSLYITSSKVSLRVTGLRLQFTVRFTVSRFRF